MPDDLPFVPDATLDLVDAGWWLDLCCACGRSTSIPHRRLVQAHGRLARVPSLLARLPAGAAVSFSNAAAFLLVAILAGAVLWRERLPFWARVVLTLLGMLGMLLTLLSGMRLL